MSLFRFVEQQDLVRPSSDGLSEHASLLVANVARRRPDEARDGMAFGILGHVDARHSRFIVEHEFSQGFCEFCLSHAAGSQQEECPDRLFVLVEACPGHAHCICDGLESVWLADDSLRELIFHFQQLLSLLQQKLGQRNSRMPCDDRRDIGICHCLRDHHTGALGVIFRVDILGVAAFDSLHLGLFLFDFAQLIREELELDLRSSFVAALLSRTVHLEAKLLHLLLSVLEFVPLLLFLHPELVELVGLPLLLVQDSADLVQSFLRKGVIFGFQRLLFDPESENLPLQHGDGLGLAFLQHAQPGARLVEKVNGLIGKFPIRQVALRHLAGSHDSRIVDFDSVVELIAIFQATNDGDRVPQRGLRYIDALKPSGKCPILLYVLSILVERGGAHEVQFATREGRLDHVRGIHRPASRPSANEGV
mmetsp:Transcript_17057/g.30571  ORF Transcript_17057/g.30571 Transcript_17057/m.30571 type:complete len:421 (-) Transcript_17057:691-1953(-)